MDGTSDRMLRFLKDKSILVTGSTGFLAKIFVEKVLRVQPNVKKLFLLVRAPDAKSASHRLHDEVTGKKVFGVLRQQYEKGFSAFVSEKISPVAGDIACENLGIEDRDLRELLCREVDVVLNVAATTNFFERYDVALKANVLGAKHALDFAKRCEKLQLFLHVSTGLILEERLRMGESLNGAPGLDVDAEVRLVRKPWRNCAAESRRRKREGLHEGAGHEEARSPIPDAEARFFGWPNTYVFTKALGEMMIGQQRGDTPVVIIRPTIITSTHREPFPGWVEGTRTIDSLVIGYAEGNLPIPGDMVVNAMIIAMEVHANQRSEFIYHVGSSVSNPLTYARLKDYVGKDGKIIKTRDILLFTTITSFRRYMALRYWLPLEGLRLVNAALCGVFSQLYDRLSRKYKFVMHLVDLYEPYAFFKGCFDDLNLVRLRAAAGDDHGGGGLFDFDPKSIDWNHYFSTVHFPGVVKYVLK
ncbi:unnamed protein product [Spirodela intermedia]|uniref:Fatty acyl-CoA reductase n=1 Tax=Spirodela intermedia TaxID=51605 RepID=A0A7I8ISD5_SPIIN|nr:unnamed protein product [Spirodela intermedia]CAA6660696.1 unnamed protein product [Spirodela intermedia]